MIHRRRNNPEAAPATPSPRPPPSPQRPTPLPLPFPTPSPSRSPRREYPHPSYNGNSGASTPIQAYGQALQHAQYAYAQAPSQQLGHGLGQGQHGLGYFVNLDAENRAPAEMARRLVDDALNGMKDAGRVQRSIGLVMGDAELRNLVVKVTLINLLSLSLLALFPFVLGPLFHSPRHAHDAQVADTVGFWYNALINYPLFAACFLTNAVWGPRVARRASGMLHPVHRLQTAPATTSPPATVMTTVTRLMLIADFTLVSRTLALIPLVGRPLATSYICVINAYYAYESIFASRQWPLDYRCSYVSARAVYMFGFGLPATLLTSFGPPLINMAIFALIYPFLLLDLPSLTSKLLIQALQSRPPSASSLLTPSPSPSAPSTPTELGPTPSSSVWPSPSGMKVQVPIFFFARHALVGIEWLSDALARERGPSLERLKRQY